MATFPSGTSVAMRWKADDISGSDGAAVSQRLADPKAWAPWPGVSAEVRHEVPAPGVHVWLRGDVRLAAASPAQKFSYHMPDIDTGAPGPGATDNTKRMPAAYAWRTVMKAAGIPDRLAARFPATKDAKPLAYMLRG